MYRQNFTGLYSPLFGNDAAVPGLLRTDYTNERTFDRFTPRASVSFEINDAVTTYASYSEGFKSGGWTTRLSNPITDGSFAEFKPEHAKSSEVGLKTVMFDDRLLVNTAIFYTDYDDIQLNFQEGASPVLRNAGKAELKGEVRGGRFVAGFSGEQYALPEAVDLLRRLRRGGARPRAKVGAADPLNLHGILTPDARVPAQARRRVEVG